MQLPLRVLLVGAGGQLGRACQSGLPPGVELTALTRSELDIGDPRATADVIARISPDVLINAAGYTAVDRAESEPEAAYRVNALGTENLAAAVARIPNAFMVHVSTDFVFDGSASTPYLSDAEPRPLSVYGASKLAGEKVVRQVLGARAAIVRTAWVYSSVGNNFLKAMLRRMLMGDVEVVCDQVGTPTAAHSLAPVIWRIATGRAAGTFHWTDAGVASRYDFAVAILEEAQKRGMLPDGVRVAPITTAGYPVTARRPAYSVLDSFATRQRFGIKPSHWRVPLRAVIEELRGA